jgi:hypothetical protein
VVEDLVADDARHFEALLAGDRVDDHVAVDADEVFRVEDAVLVLQSILSAWVPEDQLPKLDLFEHMQSGGRCMAHGGAGIATRCGEGRQEKLKVPAQPCR